MGSTVAMITGTSVALLMGASQAASILRRHEGCRWAPPRTRVGTARCAGMVSRIRNLAPGAGDLRDYYLLLAPFIFPLILAVMG